ncbi:sugar phosphate isomerase/epimerase family protein [Algoriphagus confluentis]|uniref:Sugar phosphate isomerase/epimerase n=1 Tax=Algoriphagus confluentis TaxID=1697556 RepID=A0ABQ6PR71_9BACT|nr:sugar phosphate isomerase/epimerase [Algoriphagus confluentis]
MIKSAVTLNLIETMSIGPWIFWHNLEESLKKAAELGFDGVELFTASGNALDASHLRDRLDFYGLELAAVGTGAGKVLQGLTLTDPDPEIRKRAIDYIAEMIDFGAQFGAPAIIGSMQGNIPSGHSKEDALDLLADGLSQLGKIAKSAGVILIYEPLNRYESNLINTLKAGSEFLKRNQLGAIRLLADLFHMNIEEDNMAQSILDFGQYIGHVHFADSNRKPMGFGHTDMPPIAAALKEINYSGYISAEAFPYPSPDEAAKQTINQFKKYFH